MLHIKVFNHHGRFRDQTSTGENIRPTEKVRWGKRPFDKGNEKTDLMKDKTNVNEENTLMNELETAYEKFVIANENFHALLTVEKDIPESEYY